VKKTVVLLVTFGGPCSIEDVPQFMRNLMGCEPPSHVAKQVADRYNQIGGCSPLPAITEEQANLLDAAMDSRFIIRTAFRYSHPSIEERINECYDEQVERIVFFMMSPFYTSRTVGSYITTAEGYFGWLPYRPETVFIHSWYKEPLFIKCWVEKIRKEAYYPDDAFYLFSAHSLPEALLDEPYKSQIEETMETIAKELRLSLYGIGWQSVPRNVTEPWIEPTVEAVIDEVARKKIRTVVQVPIGFTADHLETLYDIDIVHKNRAALRGLTHHRVSSLNTDPLFIETLKQVLSHSLQEGS
jgi:ferrochelatase